MARDRARKKVHEERKRIAKSPCDFKHVADDGTERHCPSKAVVEYVCIACEHLAQNKPNREIHASYGCKNHSEWALARMKKHALTKHPVNLLRAVAAGLAGEEVF